MHNTVISRKTFLFSSLRANWISSVSGICVHNKSTLKSAWNMIPPARDCSTEKFLVSMDFPRALQNNFKEKLFFWPPLNVKLSCYVWNKTKLINFYSCSPSGFHHVVCCVHAPINTLIFHFCELPLLLLCIWLSFILSSLTSSKDWIIIHSRYSSSKHIPFLVLASFPFIEARSFYGF